MERKKLLLNISESLSRFSGEVDILIANGEYDISIHAENVLIPLLNEIFGYTLVNANTIKKNFPAVDLVDKANRVAFQVTASVLKAKFRETLTKFIRHDLDREYDVLYILVISTREFDFLERDEIDAIVGQRLEFDTPNHAINLSKLYRTVSALPLAKIKAISDVLLPEFTDAKISYRREHTQSFPGHDKEPIHSNLVKIEFPKTLYVADLNVDKKEIRKAVAKGLGKKKRIITDRDIVKEAISQIDRGAFCVDWIVPENKLITFKNLQDNKQFLRKIVDVGTVTPITVDEYCCNEDKVRQFKELIGFVLRERLRKINIEWSEEDKVFRFKAGQVVKETKVSWTMDRKSQPRSVIHEIWSKDAKNKHIVCFRHLAFRLSVYRFNSQWFVSIAPTYSFTGNGSKKSKYSSFYMSGIKKEEDNKAVYQHFRFLVDYVHKINESNLFGSRGNDAYDFNVGDHAVMVFAPAVNDERWNPPGEASSSTDKSDPQQLPLIS